MKKAFAVVAMAGLFADFGAASAHHSFSMFDAEHPVVLQGAVKEYKFTSPHTFIVLVAPDKDGNGVVWTLEGVSPAELVREGWSSKTIKVGDELKIKIAPFRSGIPGGSWRAPDVLKSTGEPLVVTH